MPKPKPLSKKRKMEMMEAESKITGDRISGLPERVLHRIFSFLDTKQAVQASVLGRSWRYLWTSLPVLNFDNNVWKKKNQTKKFLHFVDHVMNLRRLSSASAVQRFNLSNETLSPNSCIQSWISAAADCKVEEIHLEICYERSLVIPDCIFTSNTRVFKLKASHGCSVPISMCSSIQLKCLQLESIRLPEGDSNGELILNCPNLESLSITGSRYSEIKILKIHAPLLDNLASLGNHFELKICAPNLKSFRCRSSMSMYNTVLFETVPASLSAEIDMSTDGNKDDGQRMINLFKGLCNAYALTITECSLKAFAEFPDMLEELSDDHFHMLRFLRLKRDNEFSIPKMYFPPVANFLKIFKGVETLVIEVGRNYAPRRNSFDPSCLFHYTFDRLKFVEMHYIKGCETELLILKFLLENAIFLERITITVEMTTGSGDLVAFRRKLITLAGAFNPCPIIYFKE